MVVWWLGRIKVWISGEIFTLSCLKSELELDASRELGAS